MKYRMELLKINDQLQKLSRALNQIDDKIESLLIIHNNVNLKINPNILCLPQHLQETVLALSQIGRGTASDVAQRTGKCRAIESCYLNQLVRHNYVTKSNQKRQIIFTLRNAV